MYYLTGTTNESLHKFLEIKKGGGVVKNAYS